MCGEHLLEMHFWLKKASSILLPCLFLFGVQSVCYNELLKVEIFQYGNSTAKKKRPEEEPVICRVEVVDWARTVNFEDLRLAFHHLVPGL